MSEARKPFVIPNGTGDDSTKICFRLRDRGSCDRQGCPYNHDKGLAMQARREKKEQKSRKGNGRGHDSESVDPGSLSSGRGRSPSRKGGKGSRKGGMVAPRAVAEAVKDVGKEAGVGLFLGRLRFAAIGRQGTASMVRHVGMLIPMKFGTNTHRPKKRDNSRSQSRSQGGKGGRRRSKERSPSADSSHSGSDEWGPPPSLREDNSKSYGQSLKTVNPFGSAFPRSSEEDPKTGWPGQVMRPEEVKPSWSAPVFIKGHERCAESFSIKNTTMKEGPSRNRAIATLKEIPREWWTKVDNPPPGYNYRTVTEIAGYPVETLLDGGASVSSVREELVVGAVNLARKRGIHPRHDNSRQLSSSVGLRARLLQASLGGRSWS